MEWIHNHPVTIQDTRVYIKYFILALEQFGAIRTEKRGWRPQGQLVAHFHEHGSAVNRIAVSEQQNYFVTCSDDGQVKLWNMDRIEGRKLGCKARKTIPLNAGRIKTVKFCRDNVLVGATDDGSIVLSRPLEAGSNDSVSVHVFISINYLTDLYESCN